MSEEILDILNADGEQTGQRLSKSEVHRQGLWHLTAHCWLVTPDGKLLVQRRSPTMDTHPNCWDISSAGHISAGETSQQGAIREFQEELGLMVAADELDYLGQVHSESVFKNGTYINREYQDIFLVTRAVHTDTLLKQHSEVSEIRLVPWSEIQQRVTAADPEFVPHEKEYQLLFSLLAKRFPYAHTR